MTLIGALHAQTCYLQSPKFDGSVPEPTMLTEISSDEGVMVVINTI